ncbi:hypothetical protein K0M31_005045 [Melipona bicolor]|uniref:Uncharacterized protein n=1 Tax=Melipona bicolor TaxID=60889 RepID=A0AA40FW17_9HYME|nr:hypothetical protein K0M31_005045 [Melipona bicolor]
MENFLALDQLSPPTSVKEKQASSSGPPFVTPKQPGSSRDARHATSTTSRRHKHSAVLTRENPPASSRLQAHVDTDATV